MPRKKTTYKYYQLPQWDNAVLDVVDVLLRNNKRFMAVMDGCDKFIMKTPKRKGWAELRTGDTIVVTKHLQTEKMAWLELVHVANPQIP